MPGFTSRTADMNGYNDFERGHHRTSSYQQNGGIDPYRRDEFYREEPYNDLYSRQVRSNGYGNDIDQGSLDGRDMRDEPTFEVDHLATYSSKTGVMHAEDGLRKLRQMENTTGIWTMRCLLIVERKNLIVIDKGNGEELERFPIQLVHEPTAIFKDDRREIYTNLILFTILDDPRKRNSQQRIPPPPNHSAPEPPRPYDGSRWLGRTGGKTYFNYSSTGGNSPAPLYSTTAGIYSTPGNNHSSALNTYAFPNREGIIGSITINSENIKDVYNNNKTEIIESII
ncbi:hypothetical protein KUTeg_023305 [Tegillarca granosa]|uniref:PTB domain-containing protein n=1 Tax=Tegillarca granosa TaxID=220873 RepID=A0ABQ9E6Z7_TEGGR|nr:hypothetical protein KUTeg_023305 [Tegillarca granosa]